jgi:hypothetical protein
MTGNRRVRNTGISPMVRKYQSGIVRVSVTDITSVPLA